MKLNPEVNTQKNGGIKYEMQLKRTEIIFTSFNLKEMCWAEALDMSWNAVGMPALRTTELTYHALIRTAFSVLRASSQ